MELGASCRGSPGEAGARGLGEYEIGLSFRPSLCRRRPQRAEWLPYDIGPMQSQEAIDHHSFSPACINSMSSQ